MLAAGANLVALCDCDESNAAESFASHPQARKDRDWRRLLDASKDLDAVELLNTTQGQVSQTVAVVADYGGSLDTILEDA